MGLFSKRKQSDEGSELLAWASALTPGRSYPDWLPEDAELQRLYSANWPFYVAAGQAGAALAHSYLRLSQSPVAMPKGMPSEDVLWRVLCRARTALVIWYAECSLPGDDVAKEGFLQLSLYQGPAEADEDEQALLLWRVVSGQAGAPRERGAQLLNLARWIVAPLGLGARIGNDLGAGVDASTSKKVLEILSEARIQLAKNVGEDLAEALTRVYGSGLGGFEADEFMQSRLKSAADMMNELMQTLASG